MRRRIEVAMLQPCDSSILRLGPAMATHQRHNRSTGASSSSRCQNKAKGPGSCSTGASTTLGETTSAPSRSHASCFDWSGGTVASGSRSIPVSDVHRSDVPRAAGIIRGWECLRQYPVVSASTANSARLLCVIELREFVVRSIRIVTRFITRLRGEPSLHPYFIP